VTAWLILTLV